jgi:hypothetical protein
MGPKTYDVHLSHSGREDSEKCRGEQEGGSNKMIMSGCGMTTLTMKDEKRLEIIQRVLRGELTLAEAGLESQSGSVTGSKRG